MQSQVFKPGDEPLKIAAATMDIFSLLPQASNFVEALVRRTLDLESVMFKYKSSLSTSPFRKPLAKYLNRYYQGKRFLGLFLFSWMLLFLNQFVSCYTAHCQVLWVSSWKSTVFVIQCIATYFKTCWNGMIQQCSEIISVLIVPCFSMFALTVRESYHMHNIHTAV